MGSKSTPEQPATPDPAALAAAQGDANLNTAISQAYLNATNQTTPYGSSKFNTVGYETVDGRQVPRFEQVVTLSPDEQQKLDLTNDVAISALNLGNDVVNRVHDTVETPFSIAGAPAAVSNVTPGQIQSSVPSQTFATSFGDSGQIKTSLDTSGVSDIPGLDDFGAQRDQVAEALFSRLDPQFDRDRSTLETQISNQGIARNTQAWNDAIDELNRNKTDARYQATLAAGQEQGRLYDEAMAARNQTFGEALSSGNFWNTAQGQQYAQDLGRADFMNSGKTAQLNADMATGQFANAAEAQRFNEDSANAALQNAARERYIQEQDYLRNQPINELSAILGFSNGIQMPNFSPMPTTQVATTDVLGANKLSYDVAMNNYNQALAQNSSAMGGIFDTIGGLGSALIMSDEDTKDVLAPLPTEMGGVPEYLFTYKGDDTVRAGVMAQDVEKVHPHAVRTISGIKHVDYGRLLLS